MPNDANKLTKTAYPQPQMPQLAPPVLWPVAEVSFRIRQDCLVYQGNPMLLKSHESDTFTLNTAEHHCSTMQR